MPPVTSPALKLHTPSAPPSTSPPRTTPSTSAFKSEDTAGNIDYAASSAISGVTNAATVDLKDSSDSGAHNDDDITNDNTPTLVISGFRSTDTVTVTASRTGSSDVTAELTGNGEVTLAALVDGVWSITAANATITSPALEVTIDTVAPVLPNALTLANAASDGIITASEKDQTTAIITVPTATDADASTTIVYGMPESPDPCDASTSFYYAATPPATDGLGPDNGAVHTVCAKAEDRGGEHRLRSFTGVHHQPVTGSHYHRAGGDFHRHDHCNR